jgi:hypothetical protein
MLKAYKALFIFTFIAGMIVMLNGEITMDEYFFTWAAAEGYLCVLLAHVKQHLQKEVRDGH